MDTVAAIDCGTNSIKLLIAHPPATVLRDSTVVRLGQGVGATGELRQDALVRTFAAIDDFAEVIRRHGIPPERVRFCATSAARDARNADVFTAGVRERLGVTPEVLSGAEEAALVYAGTVSVLPRRPTEPVLIVDIGGGSTELVLGEDGPLESVSMDIGSVRLHERHLHDDPPTAGQVAACVADIDDHLDTSGVQIGTARSVIGTSGSVKTLACAVLDLPAYDPRAFDGAELANDAMQTACARLVTMDVEQRKALPYMHPGRADVIGAGALIWSRILARVQVPNHVVSEADILNGIAASIGA